MAEGGIAAAHGQRVARGQLAGPLPRHHARRQAAEQLAHGPAPRPGVAGPRARARGVGRAVRSHQGRTHPAARLRRPPLRAPGPRRRPHRPRDDPHAAEPRRRTRHRRASWSAPSSACCKDGDRVCGAVGYWRESGRVRRCSRPRRSCSPPAASARPTRSRRTRGSTPATASRWRSTPAPT